MYLNLFHNGKKYIYETGNKLNIGHLKEISEGILKSNKNIMEIIYDNPSTFHKYINPNDKTFLRDLIPKGQRRAQFSIKFGSGNLGSSENSIKFLQKSADSEKGMGDFPHKNIFGNFSYMYSAQKKFNMMITNKFNELLLELRELLRRINEVYDEIYKNFAQSNINYNKEMTKNNKADVNNKMKQIIEYEFHMIKFFDKEKIFYEKLNAVLRRCLLEQNGKIVVSNKTMKDLYKNMFTDNDKNFKLDLNEKNEYISNIIENPIKNSENSNMKKNKNFLSLEDELFHDKIFKNKSKNFLHSLSSLSINNFSYKNNKNNNSNFNFNTNSEFDGNKTNNNNHNILNLKTNKSINRNNSLNTNNSRKSKLMISTEVGPDGVQRGKITLFSNEIKSKKDIDSKNNKEKSDKTKGENETSNDEKNSNKNLDLIKNLDSRNRKSFGFSNFKTNLNINKNINIFSTEEKDNKKRLNSLKLYPQKNEGTNMSKELNGENKDNKENKKDSKHPSITGNENASDSTDYLNKDKNNNKGKSNIDLNKIDSNKDNINKKEGKDENKNDSNNKENNNNDPNFNKENNENDNNINNKINDETLLILNKNDENSVQENGKKKKKKAKKERKKRKNSSEDNSSDNDSDKEKKKAEKKKNNSNEDSKASEKSKKDSSKDLFDLHLLRNLSPDKDNPYKKRSFPLYGTGMKKLKENTLIRPDIPDSDDSEEEKKKLALVKKKKKNHIKNKYDFLI